MKHPVISFKEHTRCISTGISNSHIHYLVLYCVKLSEQHKARFHTGFLLGGGGSEILEGG